MQPVPTGRELSRPAQRVCDLLLVVVMAPLWAPVLLLAAAATAIFSGRPVFFTQRRMGKGGRPFTILKLRTMSAAAAAPAGVLFAGWTYAGDPRVTRVGRVLRRCRLDELPQLLNVLRGDMSIVGPRPEPWDVAIALGEQIPGYAERHRVRPGLTGLCQISPAYYDFGTVEKSARKLELDLRYVANPSLLADLAILLRTVPALLRNGGMA